MFAEELRRAIEAAARITLPQVAALLWQAYTDGHVTEAEAAVLSDRIDARREAAAPIAPGIGIPISAVEPAGTRRSRAGARPRSDASHARRRRWAASGRLPPGLATHFTLAEVAVLAAVAVEVARRGDCRLAVDHLAALAGVSRSTVKGALRLARGHGLVSLEERRRTGQRSDTNVVRVISPEWRAWMRLARRDDRPGGGVRSAPTTNTGVPELRGQREAGAAQGASEGERAGSARACRTGPRFAPAGGAGRASHAPGAERRSA